MFARITNGRRTKGFATEGEFASWLARRTSEPWQWAQPRCPVGLLIDRARYARFNHERLNEEAVLTQWAREVCFPTRVGEWEVEIL